MLFAHSLAPINVGYIVAHGLSLFLEVGHQGLIELSDPMGTGENLLGTADWQVSYGVSNSQTLLAYTKVFAIVGRSRVGCHCCSGPGGARSAGATPDDRSAAAAVGHGGLHRRRAHLLLTV